MRYSKNLIFKQIKTQHQNSKSNHFLTNNFLEFNPLLLDLTFLITQKNKDKE